MCDVVETGNEGEREQQSWSVSLESLLEIAKRAGVIQDGNDGCQRPLEQEEVETENADPDECSEGNEDAEESIREMDIGLEGSWYTARVRKLSGTLRAAEEKRVWKPRPSKVIGVQFQILSEEDVLKQSRVAVKSTTLYNRNGPNPDSLNDHRLGTVDRRIPCGTCGGELVDCPGHQGHIQLPMGVYHPGLIDPINKVLKCVCFFCSASLINLEDHKVRQVLCATPVGKVRREVRFSMMTGVCKVPPKVCSVCKGPQPRYVCDGISIRTEWSPEAQSLFKDSLEAEWAQRTFTADRARAILTGVSVQTLETLGLSYDSHPRNGIITVLPVPPPSCRPAIMATEGSQTRGQDDLTNKLQDILKRNRDLQKVMTEKSVDPNDPDLEVLQKEWAKLQGDVASYIDDAWHAKAQKGGNRNMMGISGRMSVSFKNIKQRLKGKGGRIRGNLMGKRVNFSARTVITPDPSLDLDEVGVPEVIALSITIPERVTDYNLVAMQRCVAIGPERLGGCNAIIQHDGSRVHLNRTLPLPDVLPGMTVERYMRDGDVVAMNRQPSLHRGSMMGHRVRIYRGKKEASFGLNLSVTTPYNADFDGDEMNMHVPQNAEAQAEVLHLMHVSRQIVTSQSSKPIMGLVQDACTGAFLFSGEDVFLTRADACSLIMEMTHLHTVRPPNSNKLELPPPAILKPKELWTGKQIFSLLLPRDFRFFKTLTNHGDHRDRDPLTHNAIEIRRGEMIRGKLQNSVIGRSTGSIVHRLFREKGPLFARNFLSDSQRLLNRWLAGRGFSVGLVDCVPEPTALAKAKEVLARTKESVANLRDACKAEGFSEKQIEATVRDMLKKSFDQVGLAASDGIPSTNRVSIMHQAGSKGSLINLIQIMFNLGQQHVEGQRPSSRDLSVPYFPFFEAGDNSPEARGFVEHSLFEGLSVTEFFFHAMSGREGLTDTAVKTALIGYLERCLHKAMESLQYKHDGTVRNSLNQIVQMAYGDGSYDPTCLVKVPVPFIRWSDEEIYAYVTTGSQNEHAELLQSAGPRSEFEHLRKIGRERMRLVASGLPIPKELCPEPEFVRLCRFRDRIRYLRLSGLCPKLDDEFAYLPIHPEKSVSEFIDELEANNEPTSWEDEAETYSQADLIKLVRGAGETFKTHFYDAVIPRAILEFTLTGYNIQHRYCLSRTPLKRLLDRLVNQAKYSKVHVGEMLGSIGAQSIGEPATQMTLNSVDWKEKILIREGNQASIVPIGQFIDGIVEMAKNGIYPMQQHENDTLWIDISVLRNVFVPSVDEDGQVSWKKIEAVTRHPPINKDGTNTLLKVTTHSGRCVTATKAKSFLARKNNKIVQIDGDSLNVGDLLPVAVNLKVEEQLEFLDMSQYFPKSDYLYGDEFFKTVEAKNSERRGWWGKVKTNLPYSRSDRVIRIMDNPGTPDNGIRPGCVYLKKRWKKVCHIPARIPLDRNFGFFCGAYVAEGTASGTQVMISNHDDDFRKKITDLMDSWEVAYHLAVHPHKDHPTWISKDLFIHSKLLAQLMDRMFKSHSHLKEIPPWVFIAKQEFVEGFIDGYISGDGTVNKNGKHVRTTSASLTLSEQFAALLSRCNIKTRLRTSQPSTGGQKSFGSCEAPMPVNAVFIETGIDINNLRKIGLTIKSKQDRLDAQPPMQYRNHGKFDVIPGVVIPELGLNGTYHRDELQNVNSARLDTAINNDVFWDRIVSISEVQPTEKWVYDLTVADTRNFNLANSLCCRDTFHFSGVASKNVTLGVPRLKELINVASKQKTASCTVYLKRPFSLSEAGAKSILKSIQCSYLKHVVTNSNVVHEPPGFVAADDDPDNELRDLFEIFEQREADVAALKSHYVIRLELNKHQAMERNLTPFDVAEAIERFLSSWGADIQSSDQNMDSWVVRIRLHRIREMTARAVGFEDVVDRGINQNVETELLKRVQLCGIAGIEGGQVRKISRDVADPFTHALKTVEEWVVDTQGTALSKILALAAVDPTRTISNDVSEVLRVLGVQAAATVLFHELKQVIFFDGTYIDLRHIMLLVDTMTHLGYQVRISRHGINKLDNGPMLKLSFEETYDVVINAALYYEKDEVCGPTPSVMMGQLAPMGTALVELKLVESYLHQIRERFRSKKGITNRLITTSLIERLPQSTHFTQPQSNLLLETDTTDKIPIKCNDKDESPVLLQPPKTPLPRQKRKRQEDSNDIELHPKPYVPPREPKLFIGLVRPFTPASPRSH